MSLRINSNIAAMNAYRNLSVNDKQMQGSLEKLSSGLRINRAADDAAGLSIAQGLQAQIGGLKVATRNAQDGVNVVQTADGALNESAEILQRMRDLAVQAANGGSQDANAQAAAQTEFGQLQSELDRIAKTTSFGGQKLLDVNGAGAYQGTFQVGANNSADDRIQVNLDATVFGTTGTKANSTVAATFSNANFTGATIEADLDGNSVQVTLSAGVASLDDVVSELNNNSAFNSTFIASKDGADLKIEAKVAATQTITVTTTGTGATVTDNNGTAGTLATGFDSAGLGLGSSVKLDSTSNAQAAITALDGAIKSLSTARATLGAYQNRFEHTINNINVQVENLSASKSAITDTDMANEMVKFTRSQILSQAGTAMLAQANQAPQSVLQLLRG